ncbi:MAG: hypothetical protein JXR76_18270, partial [Deltaproteobacteria bacterium]|nr:hypothetical protein [Deltaproteobacteria bacterium]
MNDSIDYKEIIAEEMKSIQKTDWLRPGMAYDLFSGEFSQLLAQAKGDLALLEAAGFDGAQLPKYEAYYRELNAVHGKRVVAEEAMVYAREQFGSQMPQAENARRRLMAVARYVVMRSGSDKAQKVYDMIRSGSSDVDKLSDIITTVEFVRNHMTLANEVRPGGQPIDETWLAKTEEMAHQLLKLRGQALVSDNTPQEQIEKQNQLLTLCIRAQRDIKLFAEMAFYDDVDRYNRYYASAEMRRKNAERQST